MQLCRAYMHQEGLEDKKQAVCMFRAKDRMGKVIQGGPRDKTPIHPELRMSVAHGWVLWPVKCFPHPPFHWPSAEPWEKHPHLTEENTEAQERQGPYSGSHSWDSSPLGTGGLLSTALHNDSHGDRGQMSASEHSLLFSGILCAELTLEYFLLCDDVTDWTHSSFISVHLHSVSRDRWLSEFYLLNSTSKFSKSDLCNTLLRGISLVVKNPPGSAGDAGSIPGWGTKIPHAAAN